MVRAGNGLFFDGIVGLPDTCHVAGITASAGYLRPLLPRGCQNAHGIHPITRGPRDVTGNARGPAQQGIG